MGAGLYKARMCAADANHKSLNLKRHEYILISLFVIAIENIPQRSKFKCSVRIILILLLRGKMMCNCEVTARSFNLTHLLNRNEGD